MDDFTVERSEKTGCWIQGRDNGGLCCTVHWDSIEDMLRLAGRLADHEYVQRFTISKHGLKYTIESEKHPAPHIEARVKRGEFGTSKSDDDPDRYVNDGWGNIW